MMTLNVDKVEPRLRQKQNASDATGKRQFSEGKARLNLIIFRKLGDIPKADSSLLHISTRNSAYCLCSASNAKMPPKRKQPSKESSVSAAKEPSQTVLGGLKGGFRLSGKEDDSQQESPTFSIPFEGKEIICQRFPSTSSTSKSMTHKSPPALIFTHGAGGGIANPATQSFAKGFGQDESSSVVCFQGTMNLQNRVKTFHAVIDHKTAEEAALGGRSMGARAAVVTMKEQGKKGKLVLVSYPLVGANKEVRDKILLEIEEDVEVLFVSGDGDNMCDLKQLQEVRDKMRAKNWLILVKGADHGMSLRPKEAVDKMREYTGEAAARWTSGEAIDIEKTECLLRWDAHSKKVVDEGWKAHKAAPSKTENVKEVPHDIAPSAKRRKKA